MSSVALVGLTDQQSYDDARALEPESVAITKPAELEALNFGVKWSCSARSRVTRPAGADQYILIFRRAGESPTGTFVQSGLQSNYELKDGELRRVTEGARLERSHFNQPYSKYELEKGRGATADITTIPHTEVVRYLPRREALLIRVVFNPALGAETPQAYLVCDRF